jgi:hypothetical protein
MVCRALLEEEMLQGVVMRHREGGWGRVVPGGGSYGGGNEGDDEGPAQRCELGRDAKDVHTKRVSKVQRGKGAVK